MLPLCAWFFFHVSVHDHVHCLPGRVLGDWRAVECHVLRPMPTGLLLQRSSDECNAGYLPHWLLLPSGCGCTNRVPVCGLLDDGSLGRAIVLGIKDPNSYSVENGVVNWLCDGERDSEPNGGLVQRRTPPRYKRIVDLSRLWVVHLHARYYGARCH